MKNNEEYIFKDNINESYYYEIKDLLILCDNEFIPPLSSRISTSQSVLLSDMVQFPSIEQYLQGIKEQTTLVAKHYNHVIGFISFKHNHCCDEIPFDIQPNVYVTTVITHPDYRGLGLAEKMYSRILDKFDSRHLFTRTWSTNNIHIHVLEKMGFSKYCVKKDDRGVGIDTVYFHYEPQKW